MYKSITDAHGTPCLLHDNLIDTAIHPKSSVLTDFCDTSTPVSTYCPFPLPTSSDSRPYHNYKHTTSDFIHHPYVCSNNLPRKGTIIAHLNIRSLLPKIEEIHELLLNSSIKVLSINETFLDSTISDSEVSIPNYHLYRNDVSRNSGGIAVYLLSNFPHMENVEAISVKVYW